ncbi:putative enzymatic polyprotein [Sesamum angolense]|uniref:Enzymatic polyprotein n=1 Tax=Sesamum angolense TaxID=2727404 RepID=A0AAE2BK01_9LAMI|nr:putative enzymatic polyprotein [Sesamum angolense]
MTVSNKTMERIMRQDSNLSPYDGFRIGGIGKVLNQIGLNQRKHHIIYKERVYEIPRIFKEFAKQPVVGRYEGMLEIAGHEFLVAGVAGRENGCMTLGLSFLEDHKPWGRKAYIDSGSGICKQSLEFSLRSKGNLTCYCRKGFFTKNPNTQYRNSRAKIMIGGAFGTPWFRVKTPPIYFHDTGADILLVLRREKAFNRIMPINFRSKRGDFDAKLTNPKMQDKRKFGKVLLSFRQQGLIDSDSFYEESEEKSRTSGKPCSPGFLVRNHGEIKRGKPRLIKMESESKKFTAFSTPQGQYIWNVLPMGLANAPQIFQRKMDNLFKDYFEFMFVYIDDILIASKNMKDHIKHLEIFSDACHKEGLVLSEKKATIAVNRIEFLGILIDEAGIELQEHIVEKIRNFPDVLKDKKQLQSFLGVVNFAGIFIKDLAKYRKDFRPLLKETESAKWKWEEIHTQRIRELKQVCNNLPKLAIPQDEDEL